MLGRAWQGAVHLFLFAAAAAAPAAGSGAAEPGAIDWQCVQQHDPAFHVLCAPRLRASDSEPAEPVRTSTATELSAAGGTRADMRPVAQRGHGEVFSAVSWRVPLHSQPTDRSQVEILLNSVLCGNHPACSVDYGNPRLRASAR